MRGRGAGRGRASPEPVTRWSNRAGGLAAGRSQRPGPGCRTRRWASPSDQPAEHYGRAVPGTRVSSEIRPHCADRCDRRGRRLVDLDRALIARATMVPSAVPSTARASSRVGCGYGALVYLVSASPAAAMGGGLAAATAIVTVWWWSRREPIAQPHAGGEAIATDQTARTFLAATAARAMRMANISSFFMAGDPTARGARRPRARANRPGLAEVDGNRTRRTGIARATRFEGGGAHQVLVHLRRAT